MIETHFGRRKFLGVIGWVGVIAGALCGGALAWGTSAFAEQARVGAPCSPDGVVAAQRARVSKILGRLADEKLQFVAVIRNFDCSDERHIVLDLWMLPDGGGDRPVQQPTTQADQDGAAPYLRAHGLSQEQ